MGVSFARERFEQAWPGIEALIDAHWREVAFHGDTRPCPDMVGYSKACADGRLAIFTARDADKNLVGYASFWIGPFPQKSQIGAWQDAIYLEPEARNPPATWWERFSCWIRRQPIDQHRKPGIGIAFLRFCDAELGKMGCQVIHHSVREGRDFSPVLRRLGYVMAETVWAKQIAQAGG